MTEFPPEDNSQRAATASSGASAEQLERIAQIRKRRAAATASASAPSTPAATQAARSVGRPKRRRHAAQGSRILAAGLGATTMFGIVTVFGLDNPVSNADTSVPTAPAIQPTVSAAAQPPVQVVIHRIPATIDPAASAVPPAVPEPALVVGATDNAPAQVPAAPVQLTANPVVQTITVAAPAQPRQASSAPAPRPAPAPAATTNGSN